MNCLMASSDDFLSDPSNKDPSINPLPERSAAAGAQASASFKLQCEVDVGTYEEYTSSTKSGFKEIDATNLYTEFLFGGVDSLNSELFFRSIFCRNLPCYYDK